MGKQWKSNLHLQEKWLAWLLRGLGFLCSSGRSFISRPADNVPGLLLSLWALSGGGLCLMQVPGVRQPPGNVALHGLCSEPCLSHCGFTELQHKSIWLLVLQLNFSVHIPLTLRTYSTWYWRNILYFSVFSFEHLHKKEWKAIINQMRCADVMCWHCTQQISDGIRSWRLGRCCTPPCTPALLDTVPSPQHHQDQADFWQGAGFPPNFQGKPDTWELLGWF